jgi:hypothetical protein
MIYQHEARGADQLITSAIDAHVQGQQRKDDEGPAGASLPRANGTLMARKINNGSRGRREQAMKTGPDLGLSSLERVTGIEPALSAWESVPSGPVTWPDLRGGVSASDRERPLVTGVNGPLMARRSWPRIIVARRDRRQRRATSWYGWVCFGHDTPKRATDQCQRPPIRRGLRGRHSRSEAGTCVHADSPR